MNRTTMVYSTLTFAQLSDHGAMFRFEFYNNSHIIYTRVKLLHKQSGLDHIQTLQHVISIFIYVHFPHFRPLFLLSSRCNTLGSPLRMTTILINSIFSTEEALCIQLLHHCFC